MKYLVIGAGGTGGCIAAYLKKGGADVEVIARSEHLEAIREKGLTVVKSKGEKFTVKIDAYTDSEYNGRPDVIFVCVKWYGIDGIIPLLERVSDENTVIIPVLNIYTAGEYLSERLRSRFVTDGCIYIASSISGPGEITMNGEIFRVIFGVRGETDKKAVLEEIAREMRKCNIQGEYSENMRRDALEKFSFVSPMAACGLFFGCTADKMQREGEERQMFVSLVREIITLSESMGISFGEELTRKNLRIMDNLQPDATTSMQRDIAKGRESEIDGLIHSVARKSKELNLNLVNFESISEKFIGLK